MICVTENCTNEATHGKLCRTCHNAKNRAAQKRFRDGVVLTHQCQAEEGCDEQIPLTRKYCDKCRDTRSKSAKKDRNAKRYQNAERYKPSPKAHKVEMKKREPLRAPDPALLAARLLRGACVTVLY